MAASSKQPLSMITAIRDYVTKMVTDVAGMKVLVMDAETTGIVSMVYTQTQILQQEVFLIDAIEKGRTDKMPHLKAVYCVRPTAENIRLLQEEFRDPKYGEYHLFFTNLTREGQIQQLAQADEHEVVQQVQEFYADFVPINHELFSLNVPSVTGLSGAAWDQAVFDRVHQGVCAALLGLKKRPVVRYQANSEMAMRLAESTLGTMDTEGELFGFRRPDVPPLLLLLDRRDDPVTPLLNQWTYQAMVHELLGINNNRVDISSAPDLPKDMQKEVVLAPEQDAFYQQNMFLNYGELAENVKSLMDAFQAKTKQSKEVSSIADMQKFVDAYPEFRKLSGDVTKHVTLLGEINRLVDKHSLMEVSQVEQELACTEDHSSAASEVENLLKKSGVSLQNKLRLVLLYALRYEKESGNMIARFTEMLGAQGASSEQLRLVPLMVEHYGSAMRSGDLFSNKSWLAVQKKNLQRSVKGVQNVYTQHTPYLGQILEKLSKGVLAETLYPYLPSAEAAAGAGAKKAAPTQILVFMLGGVTYEEARYVAEMNQANPGVRILLGGTCVHNCSTFLRELSRMDGQAARPAAAGAAGSLQEGVASGIAAMGFSPPSLDRSALASGVTALTSGVTSRVQAGVSSAASAVSKLQ
mmetsp:Transcript_29643/g.75321  ORF Transcript_29643/g.75321 Transcript_29643/m.75321 type:complete len:637 (-) Transcript_29643:127-2037(-)